MVRLKRCAARRTADVVARATTQDALITFPSQPCATVRRRALVAIVPAVGHPLLRFRACRACRKRWPRRNPAACTFVVPGAAAAFDATDERGRTTAVCPVRPDVVTPSEEGLGPSPRAYSHSASLGSRCASPVSCDSLPTNACASFQLTLMTGRSPRPQLRPRLTGKDILDAHIPLGERQFVFREREEATRTSRTGLSSLSHARRAKQPMRKVPAGITTISGTAAAISSARAQPRVPRVPRPPEPEPRPCAPPQTDLRRVRDLEGCR